MLFAGGFLFLTATAALGQTGYTGVDPPPLIGDPYVGPYVGTGRNVVTPSGATRPLLAPRPARPADGATSVETAALDTPSEVERGDDRVLTASDLVTSGVLGVAAVIAFAVSTGRFRPR